MPEHPQVDTARAERAIRELLLAVGEDPDRDGLLETPARVARAYVELLSGYRQDPGEHLLRQFEVDHDEMVIVKDIPFSSLCEHHMLPFIGRAHVCYIPGASGRVCGLSKLARLVDGYARRLQVQERLTVQVADELMGRLGAAGAMVVVTAEHLCMTIRGVREPGSVTTTSAVRGLMKDRPSTRAEALTLLGH
ncbi:MAG: cyclohydrolase FolE [Ilumatobacteraceae bacterium]|nr:cyclohydrolase FolE [Ilumatobacteraceae bacterium]